MGRDSPSTRARPAESRTRPSLSPITLDHPERRKSSVAAESVVAGHPVSGKDRRRQGGVAGEYGRGADLCQLAHLALAVAAKPLQALALGGGAGAAAVGGDDEARERYRPVVVAVVEQPRVGDSRVG